MTPDAVLEIVQRAVWVCVETAVPLLGLGISVGLIMGLIQAATQINEPGLTFVPKLGALVAGLFMFGSWMLERMMVFSKEMLDLIAHVK